MRVLSIAHSAIGAAGGRMRYGPLADEPGLDVHLVCPARWYEFGRWQAADPDGARGVTLHPLPILFPRAGPAKWYLHWYPGLARLVRALQPDVIHLWEEPWSAVALQATLLLALSPGCALVLEVDQNIMKRLPLPFELIRRFVLRRTSLVLSRSDEATTVVRACGYNGPVRPIGYDVDQTVFVPSGLPKQRPAGSALHIGYVGRLIAEKGLDDALDALVLCPQVTLAILGEGPARAALVNRAASLGIADRVTFHPWLDAKGVAAFIQNLDTLVLLTRTTPSVREQFGRVIIEAQSCGVPVIGSSCGAIPGVVGAGGFVVPERDPAALARILQRLITSPGILKVAGEAGRQNVARRFSYGTVAKALVKAWYDATTTTHFSAISKPILPQESTSLSSRSL